MLDASRFVKRFDFPAEEARRLALEFVGAEGVQLFLKNPALKDKVIRTIERYHDALSQTPDEGVIDAPVHLIQCEKSVDEFHDADGSLVCSKSAGRARPGVVANLSGFGRSWSHAAFAPPRRERGAAGRNFRVDIS